MNNAKLSTSTRLQRVYLALKRYGKLSTRQIIQHAEVCAVNSCISELRNNGISINTTQENKVFYYELVYNNQKMK